MKRITMTLVATLAAVALLAGCGGSDDDPEAADDATTTTAADDTATTTNADEVPEWVHIIERDDSPKVVEVIDGATLYASQADCDVAQKVTSEGGKYGPGGDNPANGYAYICDE